MTAIRAKRSHPAPYPKYVLDRIGLHVSAQARHHGRPIRVLDPFAGVGRIHDLPRRTADTVGVELEPEWAACRARTIVGDATQLPAEWTDTFDALITSPTYGNRLADKHEAKDACHGCGGIGVEISAAGCGDAPMFCSGCGRADCTCGQLATDMRTHNRWCPTCRGGICGDCNGAGVSRRYTYRHSLGRMPSEGSSATMQWSKDYRDLHEKAWQEAHRVVRRYGLIILNCKNHIRGDVEQTVVEWHAKTLERIGFYIDRIESLPSPGLRDGANAELRVDYERLIVGYRL